MSPENKKPGRHGKPFLSRQLAAALIVLLVAGVSACSLALLRAARERASRSLAEAAFLDSGRSLAFALARSCFPADGPAEEVELWRRLDWFFETLADSDPAFESLVAKRGGLTFFQRQASLARAFDERETNPPAEELKDEVAIETVLQDAGEHSVPIILFTRRHTDAAGEEWSIQLGLRHEHMGREGLLAEEAVGSMYRVALGTQALALAILLAFALVAGERERRRMAKRRAEEHLAFAGMLANGIVHDFRNPMSSVRIDAQMLERAANNPESPPRRLAELSRRICSTLDRMESVFREFFFLSRPGTGEIEEVDLHRCLAECAEILQARLESGKVALRVDLPRKPLFVMAQTAPLRRALLNVLNNALQAAPPGSEIEARGEIAGSRVALDILDRGPGIAPERLDEVFEMFVSTRPGGTGLGLFLARTALEVSGGDIEARPREGGGCHIRIQLPRAAATHEHDPPPRRGMGGPPMIPPALERVISHKKPRK